MALVIGLTGGIASGKSTVSQMLKDMEIPVIDADLEARRVVEKGEAAYNEVVATFGEEILLENGEIDRLKLGSIIFNDEKKRQMLNDIVHPAVRKRMLEEKEKFIERGASTIVMDIPLLFESRLTYLVDRTILVYVDENVQLQRLMNRNNFSEEEAIARIRSQMPLEKKRLLADAIIDNNGVIETTRMQLKTILDKWTQNGA